MEKIFYTEKSAYSTNAALQKILSEYYHIPNAAILRTTHGKPYVENGPHFSVTHTKNRLYIAFSNTHIGLDAEHLSRQPHYETIVKKFILEEQKEITSPELFLRHWIAKESAIKYMGSTLAHDLHNLIYVNETMYYKEQLFAAKITFAQHEEYLLAICCDNLFDEIQFIHI